MKEGTDSLRVIPPKNGNQWKMPLYKCADSRIRNGLPANSSMTTSVT
jgi:hypothetical protein